jgi:phospholipid/cholesterol/gamma-HCH transport system substrate-binding protein
LGDRSVDLRPGSLSKPVLPSGELMATEEPLELQDIIAKAAPTLDSIQKTFNELTKIADEINAGKGTVGMLIKDPKLYNHTLETVDHARTFTQSLNTGKGTLGMIVHDQKFKGEIRKTLKNLGVAVANVRQGSVPLSESLGKLPAIVDNVQSFAKNLDEAGKELPELVDTGQNTLSDVDQVAKGVKKAPIVRRLISKPKERTIQVDREIK